MQKLPTWVPWAVGGLVVGGGVYALTRRPPALKAAPAPSEGTSPPSPPPVLPPPAATVPAAPPLPASNVTSAPAPSPPTLSQHLRTVSTALAPHLSIPTPSAAATPALSLEATLAQYNLAQLNRIRSPRGLPLFAEDARLDAFARAGSAQLSSDHTAHAHFRAQATGAPGIGNHAAENQGDPRGVSVLDTDPLRNGQKQIDLMLSMMMAEGPGGGHYDTIVNPVYRRVGFGLLTIGGRLYMTNDFSS